MKLIIKAQKTKDLLKYKYRKQSVFTENSYRFSKLDDIDTAMSKFNDFLKKVQKVKEIETTTINGVKLFENTIGWEGHKKMGWNFSGGYSDETIIKSIQEATGKQLFLYSNGDGYDYKYSLLGYTMDEKHDPLYCDDGRVKKIDCLDFLSWVKSHDDVNNKITFVTWQPDADDKHFTIHVKNGDKKILIARNDDYTFDFTLDKIEEAYRQLGENSKIVLKTVYEY